MVRNTSRPRPLQDYRLHPLINTQPDFTVAQDVAKRSGDNDSAFFSLNQHVVDWSHKEKWGLKYAIRKVPDKRKAEPVVTLPISG